MPDSSHTPTLVLKPENPHQLLDLGLAFNRPGTLELEIDLGCGKGRFLLARALASRETCFLGIDRRRMRIAKIERAALRMHLENIRLICGENCQAVETLVPAGSVRTYYLFFPTPGRSAATTAAGCSTRASWTRFTGLSGTAAKSISPRTTPDTSKS